MVYPVLVWEAGLWTTWQTPTHPSLECCRPSPIHWMRLNFDPDWRWCFPQCVENHCCLPVPGQREERGGWSRWGGEFCRTPQRLRMSRTVGWWWLTHLCRNVSIAIALHYLIFLLLFIWHCMYRERERENCIKPKKKFFIVLQSHKAILFFSLYLFPMHSSIFNDLLINLYITFISLFLNYNIFRPWNNYCNSSNISQNQAYFCIVHPLEWAWSSHWSGTLRTDRHWQELWN